MPATPARAKLSELFTIYARICTAINIAALALSHMHAFGLGIDIADFQR
jgi:hypothetical protein